MIKQITITYAALTRLLMANDMSFVATQGKEWDNKLVMMIYIIDDDFSLYKDIEDNNSEIIYDFDNQCIIGISNRIEAILDNLK